MAQGSATIDMNLQICFNFFRKYPELVDLFMHFTLIYNILQIFTLEHNVLLYNVLTRFSQFQFFFTLLPFRNIFSDPCLNVYYYSLFLIERSKFSLQIIGTDF